MENLNQHECGNKECYCTGKCKGHKPSNVNYVQIGEQIISREGIEKMLGRQIESFDFEIDDDGNITIKVAPITQATSVPVTTTTTGTEYTNWDRMYTWDDWNVNNEQDCLHDNCSSCNGTGRKTDGSMCIHMISCPCPKCTPR